MTETMPVKVIVTHTVGKSSAWNVFCCVSCDETHAAKGESRGCSSCGSGSAFQINVGSMNKEMDF